MSIDSIFITRLIYIVVFTGCYCYLTWDLRYRVNRWLSICVLAAGVAVVHFPVESTLSTLLTRYLLFAVLYLVWSLLFLEVSAQYALYLSVFFTIFMGVWISCVQILFLCLGIDNRSLLTLCTGICRVVSIVLIKRFFIRIDGMRTIGVHEMLVSLFPAIACFVANLELYDYLVFLPSLRINYSALHIYISVIFFGFAAMLVLLSSESYFSLIHYREESEKTQRQMEAQYQLFVKEQEANDQLRALHHDLKNHLDTLEAMTQTKDVQTYIANLRQAEKETESQFFTGNATLDALLHTKQPVFDQNKIDFSCLVHFTHADFLSPMEICTLFSNCIDNAVEAVMREDVPQRQRCIRLSGGEVNGNMVVRLENPYSHALVRKDGLFRTTKADQSVHGSGLMNMQRIIEKHNGTMTFKTDNGVFCLFWMIPLPQV